MGAASDIWQPGNLALNPDSTRSSSLSLPEVEGTEWGGVASAIWQPGNLALNQDSARSSSLSLPEVEGTDGGLLQLFGSLGTLH